MSVEFDVERHRDFIAARGERIAWYRRTPCACTDPLAGSRNRACALCGGVGYLWLRGPEIKQGPDHPNGMGKWSKANGYQAGDIPADVVENDPYHGMLAKLKVTTPLACAATKTLTVSATTSCYDPDTGETGAQTLTKSALESLAAGTYELIGLIEPDEGLRILSVSGISVAVSGGGAMSAGVCYVEGHRAADTFKARVRQVDERQEYARYGQLYLGDITVTTMPDELPIGEGDYVDLLDRRFKREETIVRGEALTDALHWTPAVELLSARTVAEQFSSSVVGISGDGASIEWADGEAPAAGTRVAVVYAWTPRYVVQPAMIATRRTVDGVEMPQRVVGRLMGREEFRQ